VVLETVLFKAPAEYMSVKWPNLLIGTSAVILTALMFAQLPKAPKKVMAVVEGKAVKA
jgi:hypothetical protein